LLVLVAGLAAWLAHLSFRAEGTGSVRAAVRDYLALRRASQHAQVLRQAGAESGVDPYLLAGLMVAESSGNVSARSSKGALGLFQLLPATASWRAEKLGLAPPTEEALLSDALLNTRLGADNLAWLLETYDGDAERALVAYNLGTGRLAKVVREAGGWEAWRAEREAAGDSELLAFASRVLRYRDVFRERRILEEEG
jgi:soluble lytic murein transglycosylase-like protein